MKNFFKNLKNLKTGPIYAFGITWVLLSFFVPLYKVWGFLLCLVLSVFISILLGKASGGFFKNTGSDSERAAFDSLVESARQQFESGYEGETAEIMRESRRALSEMGRLYASISDKSVKSKINEIMRITDKIAQDAVQDTDDIPQIKRFFNYYLPSTIKLLNSYDRLSSQEIGGENIEKSIKNIDEMLDTAIIAFRKRLDSLFENQALDIETDIDVMNTLLEREGLKEKNDFNLQTGETT